MGWTDGEIKEFAVLMAKLGEGFQHVQVSEFTTQVYFDALHDLPFARIRDAMHLQILEARYWPSPAVIRDAGGGRTQVGIAEHSWLRLVEAFHGGYAWDEGTSSDVLPDDPNLRSLVRAFWGSPFRAREWWRLCHARTLEDRHREFVARYQDYMNVPLDRRHALPGARGFFPEPHDREELTVYTPRPPRVPPSDGIAEVSDG